MTSSTAREAKLRAGVDLIHHLRDLALAHTLRVEVRVRTESTGEVAFEDSLRAL